MNGHNGNKHFLTEGKETKASRFYLKIGFVDLARLFYAFKKEFVEIKNVIAYGSRYCTR